MLLILNKDQQYSNPQAKEEHLRLDNPKGDTQGEHPHPIVNRKGDTKEEAQEEHPLQTVNHKGDTREVDHLLIDSHLTTTGDQEIRGTVKKRTLPLTPTSRPGLNPDRPP